MENLASPSSPNATAEDVSTDLRKLLSNFAKPHAGKAAWQVINTLVPFMALWALMAWTIKADLSYFWTLLLSIPAAGLQIRLFIFQHDCGHGSFLSSTRANNAVGACLGLLTLFPYSYWKRTHSIHHATSGNLDKREIGDINTLTVREYNALPWHRKIAYRLYRNIPLMLFVGPIYQFVLKHRFPFDMPLSWKKEWLSVLLNNLMISLYLWGIISLVGVKIFLMVHTPIILLSGALGIWLFYVQHNFEHAYWSRKDNWDVTKAAMEGSSFFEMPAVLHWFTGNIGFHHIHHLVSRIPNYRLKEAFLSSKLLQEAPKLTWLTSFSCARLKLWDEERQLMVGFP